ncbi:7-cyano-7-deazaguanine synthase [Mariniblastus sp.]|nr:7-cyano-7-deazaguanine synthase [Mariniblastus sp.]
MKNQPSPAIVCLSGGMDSTSLLMNLLAEGRTVYGLSFDYGQKHRIELERLKANLAYLASRDLNVDCQTLDISMLGELFHSALTNDNWEVPTGHYEQDNMKATVVPNRNAIFASIAYGYALSVALRTDSNVDFCLGVHSGDHAIYPDCRPEFYDAIYHAFSIGNWDSEKVQLHLPYLNSNKTKILQDASRAIEKLELDFDTVFKNTCTSYQPSEDGRSHGLTGSDVERILAFHEIGRVDPIEYLQPWDVVLEQALAMEKTHQAEVSAKAGIANAPSIQNEN